MPKHQHDVEPAAAGFEHRCVESWPLGLGAADSVCNFMRVSAAAPLKGHDERFSD